MQMGINYWVMEDEPELAIWYAGFPKGNMTDPWKVLPFVQKVLEAAEREEVYRVKRAPWRSGDLGLKLDLEYRAYPGEPSYGEYIEQVLRETDKLIFPNRLRIASPGLLPEYRVIAPARLSYYDLDGDLIDKEVEDVGELLQRLRPMPFDLSEEERNSYNYDKKSYMASGSAIFLGGQFISKDSSSDYCTYLRIYLHTDIWFPKVGGFLEDHSPYQSRVFHDNRELALRHTPRLNQFLASVRDLTLEFGGTWKVDYPSIDEQYNQQFNENGINLDF
jgi:hypothetical protein